MTESEWLTSEDPRAMLEFIRGTWCAARGNANAADRKLRLFACACCRRIWHLLTDECSRAAVEAAERYADALITEFELAAAGAAAWDAWGTRVSSAAAHAAAWGTRASSAAANAAGAAGAAGAAAWAFRAAGAAGAAAWAAREARAASAAGPTAWAAEQKVQVALLRDIFGNPYRSLVYCWKGRYERMGEPGVLAFDSAWLTWHDGIVVKLAQAAYDERHEGGVLDNARLAVLADALEEAGCVNDDILGHLRSKVPAGPHVRGCWAIDCILGKE